MNGITYNDGVIQAKEQRKLEKERQRNLTEWISFFRANPARFCVHYLGIKWLTAWQQINLHLMFQKTNIVWIASRGLGKTFLSILYCVARAILYPGSQIVYSSMTMHQTIKYMNQKLFELKRDFPNVDCEIEKISLTSDSPQITFWNGSVIWLAPSTENALGFRANVFVIDEYRKVKEEIIKTVFVKFLTKTRVLPFKLRQDKNGNYLYKDYPDEKNAQIYISSQAPTYEEAFTRYTNTIKNMFKMNDYMAICMPYYLGMQDGIITKEAIINELKEEGADMSVFSLEYECIPFGSSSNAWFTNEMFRHNRRIHKIFIPMSGSDYLKFKRDKTKNPFYMPKENGEKRILAIDTASTNNANSANSIIHCIRLIPKKSGKVRYYEKQVVYIKNIIGDMNHTAQAKFIKRIFYQFEANTIVIDGQGNSLGVMHQLILPCYDEDYDENYKAFITMNDDSINEMCREPEGETEEVVYSVKVAGASAHKTQHEYNTYTRTELVSRHIKIPVEETDGMSYLLRYHDYEKQEPEVQAEWVSVYKQCDALIAEAVNLEKKMVDGGTSVQLVIPKKSTIKRRDRIIALQYGMLYAQQLENEDFKFEESFDISSYGSVSFGKGKSLNPFSRNYDRVNSFGWNRRR